MTDVSTTQISALRQLTRKAGQAQRLGYGLAGVFGGGLLLIGYLWTYLAPNNNDSINLLRAVLLGIIWTVSLPLFRQFYATEGRVKDRLTPTEIRQRRWTVLVGAVFIALFLAVVFYQVGVLGWPSSTERLVIAPTLIVMVLGLTTVLRHHAAGFMLIALNLLSQPLSQLYLAAYHRYLTLPVMLIAAFLMLWGAFEHWRYLKMKRQLTGATHD